MIGQNEHVTQENNFNIKDNMRAGIGIMFQEDNHRDLGPSYDDQFSMKNKSRDRVKYSINEYNKKFLIGENLRDRAITYIRDHINSS